MSTLAAALIGIASVIDGDTLEMHGKRIRLHGVDAPEGRQTCERGQLPWRCGSAAANALDGFIAGRTVECEQTDVDRWERVVARCSVAGVSLNAWLVENGWAMDYPRFSKGEYAPAQERAAAQRLGIWGSEFLPPWEWRAQSRKR